MHLIVAWVATFWGGSVTVNGNQTIGLDLYTQLYLRVWALFWRVLAISSDTYAVRVQLMAEQSTASAPSSVDLGSVPRFLSLPPDFAR